MSELRSDPRSDEALPTYATYICVTREYLSAMPCSRIPHTH